MNNNVYDVVFQKPAIEASEMPIGLEELAQSLVKTGRLRIDSHEKINFVRYSKTRNVQFFSYRELHDPKLYPKVEKQIGRYDMELLRRDISTNQPVSIELETRLARLFVQSNHPAVISLILLTETEVFLSFSHNIGDLLDLEAWQIHGSNSGMQSIGSETRIYVSSDGDPFETDPERAELTKYSIARFMTIAAQETGHFADLKRDSNGRPYARFSLDLYEYKASEKLRISRNKDIEFVNRTRQIFENLNIRQAAKVEKSISFFRKHRKNSFKHLSTIVKAYFLTQSLQRKALKSNVKIAQLHSAKDMFIMLGDMRFNLSPQADVYKDKNKTVEEAIACVEALARVPQQVIKWGHPTVRFMYPNLYRIYYNEVIPANIKAVENISGKRFRINMSRPGLFKRK